MRGEFICMSSYHREAFILPWKVIFCKIRHSASTRHPAFSAREQCLAFRLSVMSSSWKMSCESDLLFLTSNHSNIFSKLIEEIAAAKQVYFHWVKITYGWKQFSYCPSWRSSPETVGHFRWVRQRRVCISALFVIANVTFDELFHLCKSCLFICYIIISS